MQLRCFSLGKARLWRKQYQEGTGKLAPKASCIPEQLHYCRGCSQKLISHLLRGAWYWMVWGPHPEKASDADVDWPLGTAGPTWILTTSVKKSIEISAAWMRTLRFREVKCPDHSHTASNRLGLRLLVELCNTKACAIPTVSRGLLVFWAPHG